MPSSTYTTDNSNPTFETKLDKKKFDKKFGGVAIENEKDRMIVLCPKMYYPSNIEDTDTPYANGIFCHYTAKGVNKKQNPLEWVDFDKALDEGTIKTITNTSLRTRNGDMSKIITQKKAITPVHTKYRVLPDFKTCIPLNTRCSNDNSLPGIIIEAVPENPLYKQCLLNAQRILDIQQLLQIQCLLNLYDNLDLEKLLKKDHPLNIEAKTNRQRFLRVHTPSNMHQTINFEHSFSYITDTNQEIEFDYNLYFNYTSPTEYTISFSYIEPFIFVFNLVHTGPSECSVTFDRDESFKVITRYRTDK
jgi:hypothetical protein